MVCNTEIGMRWMEVVYFNGEQQRKWVLQKQSRGNTRWCKCPEVSVLPGRTMEAEVGEASRRRHMGLEAAPRGRALLPTGPTMRRA